MSLFNLYINPDSVEMLHQTIYRPSYIGVGEWIEFWENVKERRGKEKVDAS